MTAAKKKYIQVTTTIILVHDDDTFTDLNEQLVSGKWYKQEENEIVVKINDVQIVMEDDLAAGVLEAEERL